MILCGSGDDPVSKGEFEDGSSYALGSGWVGRELILVSCSCNRYLQRSQVVKVVDGKGCCYALLPWGDDI